MHEALKVVSAKSPTLIDALRHAKDANNLFVCLDGTLIRTDRVASKNPKNRHDLWYSGKHKAFGGNVQVLTDESGYPLWVSPVSPGSTHDITAAREHVLEVISTVDICVLADKGYIGAGHNVHTPIRGRNLADDECEYNRRLNGLRAPAERANAMLKQLKALSKCNPMPQDHYSHRKNCFSRPTPSPQNTLARIFHGVGLKRCVKVKKVLLDLLE
ncbi:transposase family protein [Corynebacterium sp.]|uniref:transposase family protein n=1 Tax=Corynebacterium sp. TaxID=1720 RepID=UPI0034C6595D